jgi:exopolyphosphatase/guanosine-5'-triphosphate,3'-diphosphate pyrophosphatase
MIFAAIDIGTNAARLLFANVFEINEQIFVEKATLVRIPTRLGEDVYTINRISENREKNLIRTLKAFKLLIDVYSPVDYDACATAAMREAENGMEILKRVRKELSLKVRLIDGQEEATIIRRTNKMGFSQPSDLSLYIDVGGGSTDISLVEKDRIVQVKSFKIGTLRILKDKVKKKEWQKLKTFLNKHSEHFGKFHLVGSGGNINKINKLYGDPVQFTLSMKQLEQAYTYLRNFTVEERISKLGLRPDRADVIVPAAEIFIYIMNTVKANEILVPKIGLADGLVYQLFERYNKKS